MSVEISDELQARREELNAQLCALQSQHANITRELQLAEADRRAAIADGQDVTILTEHLRHRQIGLQQTSWAIEQICGQLTQIDAKLRRPAPHQTSTESWPGAVPSSSEFTDGGQSGARLGRSARCSRTVGLAEWRAHR